MPLVLIVWLISGFGNAAHGCDMSGSAHTMDAAHPADHSCCAMDAMQASAQEASSCQIQSDCQCSITAANATAVPVEHTFRSSLVPAFEIIRDLYEADTQLQQRSSELPDGKNGSPPDLSSAPPLHLQYGVFLN